MRKLDTFTTAYIEAMLFAGMDESEPNGGEPLDANYDIRDIAPSSLDSIIADCKQFQSENWELIQSNLKRAGHDFLLTRNGHGCGFWDGDWPEETGEKLTEASHRFGETDCYVGDDGKLYVFPERKPEGAPQTETGGVD